MKRIVTLLILLTALFSLSVTAFAEESYSNADIIKEVVYAYDRQGDTILYDQLNSRRHVVASPEDATSQNTIYFDCSSFVNSCYIEAFGINILPYPIAEKSCSTSNYNAYARDNEGNPDVVGYWENTEWSTADAKQSIVDFMKENLQVGDILNYRHLKSSGSTAGHVYIYVGNNTFYHCAGAGSYVVNSSNPAKSYEESEGETNRIQYISFANIFTTTTSSRYIFKETVEDTVVSFSLHRPLARGNVTPTENSLKRMAIAGLDSEKTSSVAPNTAVFTGDTITYTVAMTNSASQALTGVTLTDTIPTGTEFVSGSEGVDVNGRNLSWTGDVAAKATVSVSYTVRVVSKPEGARIVSDKTSVGGIKLFTIIHTVSEYSKEDISLLVDAAKGYISGSEKFTNGAEMAFGLYRNVLGVDLTKYMSTDKTPESGIYADKNGKLVGLKEGVSYEYANLNDTKIIKELSDNGSVTSEFSYSPVTDSTVLTSGIWGVREVSKNEVYTVYVKGESTENILHTTTMTCNGTNNSGKVVDVIDQVNVAGWNETNRKSLSFNKAKWTGVNINYRCYTYYNQGDPLNLGGTALTVDYTSVKNATNTLLAAQATGDPDAIAEAQAAFDEANAEKVEEISDRWFTYQYTNEEIIPMGDFISHTFKVWPRQTGLAVDEGGFMTTYTFIVVTEDGKLEERTVYKDIVFKSGTSAVHTVNISDFEKTDGYIIGIVIRPYGASKEGTTVKHVKDIISDLCVQFYTDGYKTIASADAVILNSAIDTEKLTLSTDSEFAAITAPSLYGGMTIRTGMYKIPDSVRSRLVKESDLAVGDIIIADWSGGCITYLYIGDSTLMAVNGGKVITKTIGDDIYGSDADNILVSLYAYDRYIVIRPSMSDFESTVSVESIEVTKMPDKTEYFSHEAFDPTGMVVTAILDNGKTVEVSGYTVTNTAFEYPSATVTVSYLGFTDTFDVNIARIEGIEITSLPEKMSYYNKERIDITGMVVKALFSNGELKEIVDYTVSPTEFTYPDNTVTVTFGEFSKTFEVALSKDYYTLGVAAAHTLPEGALANVEGYFVGVGDDGTKEILIKDINSDSLIAVRNVPGTYPDYYYEYGDKVKFIVNAAISSGTYDYGRKYLVYSDENTDIADTVTSRGNNITFNFDNVLEVKSQSDFVSVLGTNDNFYRIIKVSGTTYYSGYKSSSATNPERFRIHKNPNAKSVADIRTNGSQVANLTLSTHAANLGENWYSTLFGLSYKHGIFPGPSSDKSFYAVYVGANQYYDRIAILDESWVLDPIRTMGVSLLLDGRIGVKVYFEYDSAVINTDTLTYSATVKNTDHGTEENVILPITLDENGRTAYSIVYVSPKDAGNTVINSVVSAGDYSVTLPQLTIPDYINEFKKHSEYEKYSNLIDALEKYISAADIYFDKNKNFEGMTELTDAEKNILRNITAFANITSKTVGNLEHVSTSLILNESVTLRHYFKVTGDIDLDAYAVEGATDLKYANGSEEYVYVDTEDIPAQELGKLKNVTVAFGEESTTITFSAYNYVSLAQSISDAKLKELTKCLFRYGNAAARIENSSTNVIEIKIAQMPAKTVYTHRDTIETLDLTGGKITVIYSDYSSKTVDITKEMISEESEPWNIGTVNYVLEYEGETVVLPIVYENTAMSVTELKKCAVGSTYEFTGVVVGAVSTHKYAELLIKDKNSDEYIGIINTGVAGSIYEPSLDTSVVNIGDEIIVSAAYYLEPTNSSITGSRGRYGANATNNDTFVSGLMIVSHNNEVEFDLTSATEISTQTELEAFLDDTSNFYKLVKFKGMKAIQYRNSSSKLGYRIFFGTGVTTQSNQNINGISPFIFHPTVDLYLTNGIKSYFSNSSSTSYSSPATTEYDVYAMLVGGNSYYYDFVIFDDNFMVK